MRTAAALLLLACACDESSPDEPMQCLEVEQEDPLHLQSSVDLLLVVANGSSMAEEQAALSEQMGWLVAALHELPRGLPDLHAAVLSDDGAALLVPDGCPALTDGQHFLSDVQIDARSSAREFNYTGALEEQLACMVAVGTSGGEVARPLESLAAALDGDETGFRRPDAALAIAIVTDGEDASPDAVSSYAERVQAHAPAPVTIAVSVVSGGANGCALDGFTDAAPAPRLARFAGAFAASGSAVSLCGQGPLLGGLAAALTDLEVGACIGDQIASPPDCRVSDLRNPGEASEAEYPIPSCDDGAPPCFLILSDPTRCPDTRSHLRLTLDRGGMPPPADSTVVASCAVGPECP